MDTAEYQILVAKPWTVHWVDSNDNAGVVLNDTLEFKEDNSGVKSVRRLNGNMAQSEVWATNCDVQPEGYVGVRSSDQREFCIRLDSPKQLSCRFPEPAARRRQPAAVALGTLLGTLIGALAGAVGGFPVMGPLLGLAAALTGSLATSTTMTFGLRDGSGASYTAEDGTSPRPPLVVGA